MHLDPILPELVATLLAVVVAGFLMRKLRQPFVVGCLVAGVVLGPHGIDLLGDAQSVERMGTIGVVFLLFFIGLEMSPTRLAESWRVAVVGTLVQIVVSVGCVAGLGLVLEWPWSRILLLGFVISLSSTAVVLRILEARGETGSPVGRSVIAILLAQDVAVVPMMLTIGVLSGVSTSATQVGLQVLGAVLVVGLFAWMVRKRTVRLPRIADVSGHHELEVFVSLLVPLGLALVTGVLGLSTGLGAFVGGMLISMTEGTRWVRNALKPFEVVFLGVFFLSVGMIMDVGFLREYAVEALILVALILLTNTFINAAALKLLDNSWANSIYGGALLSQIGEFSFVLAALGWHAGLITEFGYQMTIAAIVLSMALSPAWISLARRFAVARG